MTEEANVLDVSEPSPLGEVTVRWNGHVLKVHCSHRNMVVMQNAWGREDFMDTAVQAMDFLDLDNLAAMYACCAYLDGSEKRITREEFLDLCLPLNHAIAAMKTSWRVAWNGFEEITDEDREEADGKKLHALLTSFTRFLKPR